MVKALFVVFCLLSFEAKAAVGVVSFEPATKAIDVGSTFQVAVEGTFDTDVLGGGLTLALDPHAGLTVKNIVFNSAWDFIQVWDPITLTAQFAADVAPPSGKFTILVFEFLAQAEGKYSLGLAEYAGNPFMNSAMSAIDVSFNPEKVPAQITAVPEPAAAWMLTVGLALALLRIRRA